MITQSIKIQIESIIEKHCRNPILYSSSECSKDVMLLLIREINDEILASYESKWQDLGAMSHLRIMEDNRNSVRKELQNKIKDIGREVLQTT